MGARGSNQYRTRPGDQPDASTAQKHAVAAAVTDPELEEVAWQFHPDAEQWRTRGFGTWEQAQVWIDAGFDAEAAYEWRACQFTVTEASEWDSAEYEPEEAAAWALVGMGPATADEWVVKDVPPKVAEVHWQHNDSPVAALAAWADAGVTSDMISWWSEFGIHEPQQVQRWIDDGVDPDRMDFPETAGHWDTEIRSSMGAWTANGIQPVPWLYYDFSWYEAKAWSQTLDNLQGADDWEAAEYASRWKARGFSPVEADSLIQQGHTDPDDISDEEV